MLRDFSLTAAHRAAIFPLFSESGCLNIDDSLVGQLTTLTAAYIRADVNNSLQLSWCWWLVNVKIATEIVQTHSANTIIDDLNLRKVKQKYNMPLQID